MIDNKEIFEVTKADFKAFAERIANTHYNEVFSFCLTKLQNKIDFFHMCMDLKLMICLTTMILLEKITK